MRAVCPHRGVLPAKPAGQIAAGSRISSVNRRRPGPSVRVRSLFFHTGRTVSRRGRGCQACVTIPRHPQGVGGQQGRAARAAIPARGQPSPVSGRGDLGGHRTATTYLIAWSTKIKISTVLGKTSLAAKGAPAKPNKTDHEADRRMRRKEKRARVPRVRKAQGQMLCNEFCAPQGR